MSNNVPLPPLYVRLTEASDFLEKAYKRLLDAEDEVPCHLKDEKAETQLLADQVLDLLDQTRSCRTKYVASDVASKPAPPQPGRWDRLKAAWTGES
jgi:hypothetical protein